MDCTEGVDDVAGGTRGVEGWDRRRRLVSGGVGLLAGGLVEVEG